MDSIFSCFYCCCAPFEIKIYSKEKLYGNIYKYIKAVIYITTEIQRIMCSQDA